jgi:hypothetical protein
MIGSASRVSLLAGAIVSTLSCTALLGIDKPYVVGSGGAGGASTTGASTGGALGSGGSSASGGSGGTAGIPLDKVCETADYYAGCSIFIARCCAKLGLTYGAAACEAKPKSDCLADVEAVKNGTMTYHGEYVEQCKGALEAFDGSCLTDTVDFIDFYTAILPCWRIFDGIVTAGGSCTRDEECIASSHPRAALLCLGGHCTDTGLLEKGEKCGAPHLVCDKGLYCAPGSPMTCAPAIALGQPCNVTFAGICGPGAYCSTAPSICTASLPEGAPCQDPSWCLSGSCTNSICDAPQPLLKQSDCGG